MDVDTAPAAAAPPAPAPSNAVERVTADGLEQEVLYNTGRAMQELKLYGLAARCYEDALALADAHPEWLERSSLSDAEEGERGAVGGGSPIYLHVTEASAHNLVGILRHSGNVNQAGAVMRKYLSYA